MAKRIGAVFDIGTSKIEGFLVDIGKNASLSFDALPNGQLLFGSDIISRLNFALRGSTGLLKLSRELLGTVDLLLRSLAKKAGVRGDSVGEILCVGNSAMHHLALSIAPEKLARAPFHPSFTRKEFVSKAKYMGLSSCPEATFGFLPNLGGFVGSDALAVIISSGLYKSDSLSLVIDIGSNGEVIVGSRKKIAVTSTSAGPAFEGWRVSCGMPAVNGAIESVEIRRDEKAVVRTIGGKKPAGLCGSALIDLLKNLLERKLLDRSGRIENRKFKIYGKLYLTQADVRELQLAKAAIQAAVKILRSKFREDVRDVFLTGRFGNRLSRDNAQAIGIIPKDIDLRRVRFLHHGALEGAKEILCSPRIRELAGDLYKRICHVKLHKEKNFQKEFVQSMHF